jgi:hypothetical protein
MKNQLRYNCIPDEQLRKQEWYLVLVNSRQREVERMVSRLFKQLAPLEDISSIRGKTNGAYYGIFSILTEKTEPQVDLNQIFKGRKTRDRNLEKRKLGMDSLEDYVSRALKRGFF